MVNIEGSGPKGFLFIALLLITENYSTFNPVPDFWRGDKRTTGVRPMSHIDAKSAFKLTSIRDQSFERIVTEGSSVIEIYKRDGKIHRDDGPARISWSANGTVIEDYYKEGKRHRDDGPASIVQTASGERYEFYYINDHSYGSTAPTPKRVREVEAWEAEKQKNVSESDGREELPTPRREQPKQSPFKFIWGIS